MADRIKFSDLLEAHGVPLASNQVEFSLLRLLPEKSGLLEEMKQRNIAMLACERVSSIHRSHLRRVQDAVAEWCLQIHRLQWVDSQGNTPPRTPFRVVESESTLSHNVTRTHQSPRCSLHDTVSTMQSPRYSLHWIHC
jgi:hypothetical protein